MITKKRNRGARGDRGEIVFSASSAISAVPYLIASVFFALHLPYLPTSLEDVDSINFALGMRHFDVAHHQPHPPGYPVFILAARVVRAVVPAEPRALGVLSAVSAALGLVASFAFCTRLTGSAGAVMATLLIATTPLYWFTAARPLSDSFGLAAAITVQWLVLRARTGRAFTVAAFLAGLAAGIRSQVVWLTVPLLLVRSVLPVRSVPGTDVATSVPGTEHPAPSSSAVVPGTEVGRLVPGTALFGLGVLVWFVPLLALSGGPAAYWHALFDQGAEDLSGIRMFWTSPTSRTLLEALYYAFVAPWAVWMLAVPILLLAGAGTVVLWRRHRSALVLTAIAFGPYFLFDILFQETFTVRYALPLVVPVALLAAAAMTAMPQGLAVPAALAVAMYGAHVGGRSIAAYSRQPAPVFRLLADMREAEPIGAAPVLAPDRRASFDLRRPLAWLGPGAPAFGRQLAAPPQHEWREAVQYWNDGGRAPVWFVVDPKRAAIDLIQHNTPRRYRYALPFPALLSGTRPADLDWYQVDAPDWYVDDGWALTPEAAGVADVDGTGLQTGVIRARARHDVLDGGAIVVGGRNFDAAKRPLLQVVAGNRAVVSETLPPGAFLFVLRLPRDPTQPGATYDRVELHSEPPARVAVEQFDMARSRAVLGFGSGWHEREFNPATGELWRWLSDRGEVQYLTNGSPATLRIIGETPLRYYAKGSRLLVRAGARVLSDTTVSDDFSIDIQVPPAADPAILTLETDQTHVPAERSWRGSADRRTLGLRIYSCAFLPVTVSAPGTAVSFPPAR